MVEFRYIPPDEIAARHRAHDSETLSRQPVTRPPTARHRNVEAVLSLGDVRYITYRSRIYRIPPVPFKQGQRVLDSYIRMLAHAKQVAMTAEPGPTKMFYQEMSRLAGLLWKHVRPTGRIKRALWILHLMPNPFQSASEHEIKAITDFFLQGRMTSSVRLMSEMERPA